MLLNYHKLFLALGMLLIPTSSLLYSMQRQAPLESLPLEKGSQIAYLPISSGPTGQASVLLGHKKGGYWGAFSGTPDQFKQETNNYYTLEDLPSKNLIGIADPQKGLIITGLPVSFIPAEELRKRVNQASVIDDFVWVPIDEFTTRTTALSKSLSSFAQQSALGKSSLAIVDPSIQKNLRAQGNKFKPLAAPQPVRSTPGAELGSKERLLLQNTNWKDANSDWSGLWSVPQWRAYNPGWGEGPWMNKGWRESHPSWMNAPWIDPFSNWRDENPVESTYLSWMDENWEGWKQFEQALPSQTAVRQQTTPTVPQLPTFVATRVVTTRRQEPTGTAAQPLPSLPLQTPATPQPPAIVPQRQTMVPTEVVTSRREEQTGAGVQRPSAPLPTQTPVTPQTAATIPQGAATSQTKFLHPEQVKEGSGAQTEVWKYVSTGEPIPVGPEGVTALEKSYLADFNWQRLNDDWKDLWKDPVWRAYNPEWPKGPWMNGEWRKAYPKWKTAKWIDPKSDWRETNPVTTRMREWMDGNVPLWRSSSM